jgi:DNA helicase-4
MSGKRPPRLEVAIDEAIAQIEVKRGWFWHRLIVHTAEGRSIPVGGLDWKGATAIDQAVAAARAELAAARRKAEEVGPDLIERAEEASQLFDGSRYPRHSMAAPLLPRIQWACRRCRAALVRHQLDDRSAAALKVLEDIGAKKRPFEASRKAAIARFMESVKAQVLQAADGVVSHPPTDEQAAAIATDEDVTQILAGAGAGKTAVITCKVAHLVRNQGVPPWQILVLAFNRKAADEIKERLPPDLEHVEVRTFHSFGRQVIADIERKPEVSPLAKQDALLRKTIRDWLFELPEEVAEYGAYFANEYRSPFDFGTLQEYTDFVRSCDLRALSVPPPRTVDSLEELLTANFLALHGIPFEYRADYDAPMETREDRKFQRYKPAFRLSDRDVYIEPFQLDRDDRAPGHFTNYEARVGWKRRAHEHFRTRLIETYSWECAEGSFHDRLRVKLEQAGVKILQLPTKRLIDDILALTGITDLLATFLHHVRGAGLPPDELRRRADASQTPVRNRAFLRIFESIREMYEKELAAKKTLDWNDMIIRGARLIEEGKWTSSCRYVLVDEFQDISAGRMRLLKALKGDDVAFFVVGDDWQSINRFAGSDVRLFQECERHLGHVEQRNLSQTFRYGDSILKPTSTFVQRNRAQTQRELRSASSGPDDGITEVRAKEQKEGVIEVLDDIEAAAIQGGGQDSRPSVLVLGRYRSGRNELPARDERALELEFSTVHRAKGREADYAVVLMGGFPSRKQDDAILAMVLPPAKEEEAFAEERRLFYVATTRARRGLYLVENDRRPSPFVRQLLESASDFRRLGWSALDEAPPCPACAGLLIPSDSEKNLRCTNHPICRHLAPRCHACRKGYLLLEDGQATCTDGECGAAARPCPVCPSGVLVPRDGQYGHFLGCSRYSSEPPCTYTKGLR